MTPLRPRRTAALPTGVLAVVGLVLLVVPLVALLWRTPWMQLPSLLALPGTRRALVLSVTTATAATAISALLGTPLAWWLTRLPSRLTAALRTLLTLPLVLPPVVGGVALLLAWGRRGLVGRWLYEAFGLGVPFTPVAVVLAQVFVAMPFLVAGTLGALDARDTDLEDAARTMGADEWQVFRHVTGPLAAPGMGAGLVLCWARALGEFGATITFAGNLPGRTQTMPLAVYLAMDSDPQQAIALSVLLLATCAAVLALLRGRWFPTHT